MTTNKSSGGFHEGANQKMWNPQTGLYEENDDAGRKKKSTAERFSTATDRSSDSYHTVGDEEAFGSRSSGSETGEESIKFAMDSRNASRENSRNVARGGDDDDDEEDGEYTIYDEFGATDTLTYGRDRRGMYVPSYMDGPMLDEDNEEPGTLHLRYEHPGLRFADVPRYSDGLSTRVQRTTSAPTISPIRVPGLQTERAAEEVISTPGPKQFTLRNSSKSFDHGYGSKGGSKSFDEESPSSLHTPSVEIERGESIVIESTRRNEITIRGNTRAAAAKVDSTHGPKYGSSAAAVVASAENNSRPTRRSRGGAAPVVKAVVTNTAEMIHATVIQSTVYQRRGVGSMQTDVGELEIGDDSAASHQKNFPEEMEEGGGRDANNRIPATSRLNGGTVDEGTVEVPYPNGQSSTDQQQDEGSSSEEKDAVIDAGREQVMQSPLPEAMDVGVVPSVEISEDLVEEAKLRRKGSLRVAKKQKDAWSKGSTNRRPVANTGKENYVPEPETVEALQSQAGLEEMQYFEKKVSHNLALVGASSDTGSPAPIRRRVEPETKEERKESGRSKAPSKTGVDKLKERRGGTSSSSHIGSRIAYQPPEPEPKPPEAVAPETKAIKVDVVLHKDQTGYGMTMAGTQPVVVNAVRGNGAAQRSGILPQDEIFKINGTYMYEKDHDEVIRFIKLAGPFVHLTLLRHVPIESPVTQHQDVDPSAAIKPKAKSMKEVDLSRSVSDAKMKTLSQMSQSFSDVKSRDRGDRSNSSRRDRGGTNVRSADVVKVPPEKNRPMSKDNYFLASSISSQEAPSKVKSPEIIQQPQKTKEPMKPAIGLDDDDLSEEEELYIHPAFNDIGLLKQNNACLSVFLKFLISNSEPAPMLFVLITDYYHNAIQRDPGYATLTRWAFEIYITFLASEAPLKLSVNDGMVSSIDNVLKSSKENELRNVFWPLANFVRDTIVLKQLRDLHQQLSIGLGNNYGVHEITSHMDRHAEIKAVDAILSSNFGDSINDDRADLPQALAFCLATFFRQIGYVGGRYSSLLDASPSFICKDKKLLKYKLKKNYESKGHVFNPYLCTNVTKCQQCLKMVWGIGYQAYQCSTCERVVHRRCADVIGFPCSDTLRRSKDAKRKEMLASGRNRSATSGRSIFHVPSDDVATPVPDKISGPIISKPKDLLHVVEKPLDTSDVEQHSESDSESTQNRPSSWPKSIPEAPQAARYPSSIYSKLSDSDFDVEPELPSLSQVVSKETLKNLKGKERKKQEYINELFYTERTHVRSLKVIQRFFQRPMREDTANFSKEFLHLIYANLEEVIDVHSRLNQDFIKLRQKNEVVSDIGELLNSWFSGERGSKFKQMAAKFCEDQLYAFEVLKAKLKKDTRIVQIMQESMLNPHCGRQELKDLLPKEMQRLTKYPLLIEHILNCTPPETDEYQKLSAALKFSKNLLEHVNQAVRDCENYRRTQDMQKRLDRKPIENSTHPTLVEYRNINLMQHKMIYDSDLLWRRGQRPPIELHVALFEQFVILLQKQDDRLVLRCQNTAVEDVKFMYTPIMKLGHLITAEVATDKRAFFLVNKSSDFPQVLELVAKSREEKNRWCLYVKEAVDRYHKQYTNESANELMVPSYRPTMSTHIDATDSAAITKRHPGLLNLNDSVDGQAMHLKSVTDSGISEVAIGERLPRMADAIQQKINEVQEVFNDKVKLLSDNQKSPARDDSTSKDLDSRCQTMNSEEIITELMHETERLSELGTDGDAEDETKIPVTELVKAHEKIHKLLAALTVEVMEGEDEHANLEDVVTMRRDQLADALGAGSSTESTPSVSEGLRPPAFSRPTSYMAAVNDVDGGWVRPRSQPPLVKGQNSEEGPQLKRASSDGKVTPSENWTTPDDSVSFI